jgi:putative RNA 2'-phosphotransferase
MGKAFIESFHNRLEVSRMLKECTEHGYFRAEICPVCGAEGRFLMNDEELDRLTRTMAGVLRHFPERFELKMDRFGFVDLRAFVGALQRKQQRYHWLRPHHIVAIIETDNKGRYEHRDGMIRATYAHSFDIELDTDSIVGTPDALYYPTTSEEVDIVLEVGLKPSDRKKVHLSKTVGDAVNAGRVRTEAPIILEVDAKAAADDGIVIQKAGKTVYLTNDVPPQYLKRIEVDLTEFPAPTPPRQEPAPAAPERSEGPAPDAPRPDEE